MLYYYYSIRVRYKRNGLRRSQRQISAVTALPDAADCYPRIVNFTCTTNSSRVASRRR